MNILNKILTFLLLIVVFNKSVKAQNLNYFNSFSGQPLLLTPFIDNGAIELGRLLSSVGQLPNAPNVPSYSGFITVNKEFNSNIFFWFFPALNNNVSAPVILWLQGGPGTSGLFGLFLDQGPYILLSNTTAVLREDTWANEFHMLYVDSPVGTGYSFTKNEEGYATNQEQISENLHEFLKQFFQVYYEYKGNEFYICGETYAGKHVIHLAHKLYTSSPSSDINLAGISVGNGLFDVKTKIGAEEVVKQWGIITKDQASKTAKIHNSMVQYQQQGEPLKALIEFNRALCVYKDPLLPCATPSYFTQISGYEFYYNVLFTKRPEDYSYYIPYAQHPQTRNAIHVGKLPYNSNGTKVVHHLLYDILAPGIKEKMAVLLDNNCKVLLYYGDLDMVLPYATVDNLLQNLTWTFINEYLKVDRIIWRLDDDVAGYVKKFRNLFVVLVRNAGHFAIHDQPYFTLEMITNFIKGISYD